MAAAALGLAWLVFATGAGAQTSRRAGSLDQIKHVVIIVQENRSFDDLFEGYPGAHSSSSGKLPNGQSIRLQPISLAAPYDISHAYQDAKTAYDSGRMDGFANEYTVAPASRYPFPQYGYAPRIETKPYWEMARSYVLGDYFFSSQLDGSFVAHQYLIAGWAGHSYSLPAVFPWGCDAPSGNAVGLLNDAGQPQGITFPCFTYKTIADELDAAGISWREYSPKTGDGHSWTGFDAISQIRNGPDWNTNIVSPETRILQDIAKGNLAAVTWVIPSLPLSDHAGNRSKRGPSWVASVVNAVGKSKFWASTAIFVTWDDWGGWYDDVAPPQLGYDGLGFRVPFLCISPFAKAGYVDHTQYEFGSLLKFIEVRFKLPSLQQTDSRSKAPLNCFNFKKGPRSFQQIAAPYDARDVTAHASNTAPDNQ